MESDPHPERSTERYVLHDLYYGAPAAWVTAPTWQWKATWQHIEEASSAVFAQIPESCGKRANRSGKSLHRRLSRDARLFECSSRFSQGIRRRPEVAKRLLRDASQGTGTPDGRLRQSPHAARKDDVTPCIPLGPQLGDTRQQVVDLLPGFVGVPRSEGRLRFLCRGGKCINTSPVLKGW